MPRSIDGNQFRKVLGCRTVLCSTAIKSFLRIKNKNLPCFIFGLGLLLHAVMVRGKPALFVSSGIRPAISSLFGFWVGRVGRHPFIPCCIYLPFCLFRTEKLYK